MTRASSAARTAPSFIAPHGDARRLSPRVQVGLDAARAAAAVYVVLYHVANTLPLPWWASAPLSFGHEAVLVFFLLSGFVIFANERHRATRVWPYYLRRVRRIYPLLLVAMAVSTLVWLAGFIPQAPTLGSAIGTLLSVQDAATLKPGVITAPYLDDYPLWSLSYEMFFYAVFPAVLLLWRRIGPASTHVVGAVCVVAYATYALVPNHFSLVTAYFLVWWAGAMAAQAVLTGRPGWRSLRREAAWLGALVALSVLVVAVVGFRGVGFYPALMTRHFAVTLVLLAVLASPLRHRLAAIAAAVGAPAVAVASISYGIYVLHYPVMIQTHSTTSPWLLVTAAITVLLAIAAERGLMRLIPRVRSR